MGSQTASAVYLSSPKKVRLRFQLCVVRGVVAGGKREVVRM
jgi:hypothetical protein